MATTAGRTNVISNPKLGKTVSVSLTSSTVDVAYAFTATKTNSGTDTFSIVWATGATEVTAGDMSFTMRDDLVADSSAAAEIQHDPEGLPVVTIATVVAIQVDTPAGNTGNIEMKGDNATETLGFMPTMCFKGGDATARSMLTIPRIAISSLSGTSSATSTFTMKGAADDSITITVLGKT
jgi:hypothetical protein